MGAVPVNVVGMEPDDLFPKKADDPLTMLARQDLDPFSVDELQHRITALEQEIVRTRGKMQAATSHRASADALFKR
jgi:uncharacterized small protein (DUF1192 family)